MKKNSTNILSAAMVMLFAVSGTAAMAEGSQVSGVMGSSGSSQNAGDEQVGKSSEEDALLQSLYNEEEDAELARMLASEDYIFPTSITDNWHIDFQVGAMTTWGSYCSEMNFLKRSNLAAALSIGKYLTPVNDIRLNLFYGRGTGVHGSDKAMTGTYGSSYYPSNWKDTPTNDKYNFNTLGLSIQYLPNLTNLFCGYKPSRVFTLSALVGIGMEHTFSYNDDHLSYISVWAETPNVSCPRNLVDLQAGLHADWKLNNRWHLNLEMVYNFVDDSFDGLISDQGGDKFVNTMIGASYYIASKNEKARNAAPFAGKYTSIEDQIARNHNDIEDALANRSTNVVANDVTKNVTYTLISFDGNETEVPRLQQNNVYQTALTYKNTPDSKIFITNSSKEDNQTFKQRAWSISKLLNQRWQIPLEDVWVDADESDIQKLQIPEVKNYIIFIINE